MEEAREPPELHLLPGNTECADCCAKNPDWASVNHGVLICIECAGTHRSLGAHISKVKSTQLDSWKLDELQSFSAKGGNRKVNALLTQGGAPPAPPLGASRASLESYIRAKYSPKTASQGKTGAQELPMSGHTESTDFGDHGTTCHNGMILANIESVDVCSERAGDLRTLGSMFLSLSVELSEKWLWVRVYDGGDFLTTRQLAGAGRIDLQSLLERSSAGIEELDLDEEDEREDEDPAQGSLIGSAQLKAPPKAQDRGYDFAVAMSNVAGVFSASNGAGSQDFPGELGASGLASTTPIASAIQRRFAQFQLEDDDTSPAKKAQPKRRLPAAKGKSKRPRKGDSCSYARPIYEERALRAVHGLGESWARGRIAAHRLRLKAGHCSLVGLRLRVAACACVLELRRDVDSKNVRNAGACLKRSAFAQGEGLRQPRTRSPGGDEEHPSADRAGSGSLDPDLLQADTLTYVTCSRLLTVSMVS
eukprot:s135_g25.t1